jgi:NTE family protein
MFLGSPAPYNAGGLAEWVTTHVGADAASGWPERATAIVAHDLRKGVRVAFGTDTAPDVGLANAVAASSAVPLIFCPYRIDDDLYVDGGISSGTHADLVLGVDEPLDLVLILGPMAADVPRKRARFHEKMFDRVGNRALAQEIALIQSRWPSTDVVTLSPSPSVQNAARPNPMDASRSVPTFMRTLIAMKRTLAQPHVWSRLEKHLVAGRRARRAISR